MVEQLIRNEQVVSSILTISSRKTPRHAICVSGRSIVRQALPVQFVSPFLPLCRLGTLFQVDKKSGENFRGCRDSDDAVNLPYFLPSRQNIVLGEHGDG